MVVRIAVIAASLVSPAIAHAGQATCSNPGLPLGTSAGSSDLMPGRLTLGLVTGFLPIRSEETLDEATGPVVYDTRLVLVETRLSAEYAVRPWLAIGGAFPYRVVDIDVKHRDPSGAMIPPPTSIHSRTEMLSGIGDPSVTAHVSRELGAFRLHARVGTSLPLGGTEQDPHRLGSIGQEHQHIQFGTGTFVPFVAIEAQRSISSVTVAAWGLAHLSLYENSKGFRAGDRFSGGVSATSGFGLRAVSFSAGLEGHGETAETWQGVVYEEEGNAGRFDLMMGGGVAWRPMKNLAVVADAKVPIYSRVTGTQLDFGLVAGVGVVGTFDLVRRSSWRGLDHGAVAPAGTAADLAPVPGRITVFDLWAEWCAPCRELDDRLAVLARAHPDRIAVRKLDVVDSDSAAWKRHLAPGNFDLPHIKVYDGNGVLVFERTAPVDELVRALEDVLRYSAPHVGDQ